MSKHIICILTLSLHLVPIWCQTIVRGHISDQNEGEALPAIVVMRNISDTTIFQYSEASKNGEYEVSIYSAGVFSVSCELLGYTSQSYNIISLGNSKYDIDFQLSQEPISINEAKIISSGIKIIGDTTRYYVNSYLKGDENNLHDILKVLPGISIDDQTQYITANGKNITRILIEHQDLYQGNTSIPLNSIGSTGVDNIEVIDNYLEDEIFGGFHISDETVINVNINEKYKGKATGRVDANGGVISKYKANGNIMLLRKNFMVSSTLSGNNIGESTLSVRDILNMNGGISYLLSNEDPTNRYQKVLSEYSSSLQAKTDVCHNNNGLFSANVIYSPNRKIIIRANVLTNTCGLQSSGTKRMEYRQDGNLYVNTFDYYDKRTNTLSKINATYSPSKNINLSYSGSFAINRASGTNDDNYYLYGYTRFNDASKIFNTSNLISSVFAFNQNRLSVNVTLNKRNNIRDISLLSETDFYPEVIPLGNNYKGNSLFFETNTLIETIWIGRFKEKYLYKIGLSSNNTDSNYSSKYDTVPAREQNCIFSVRNHSSFVHFIKDKGRFTFDVGSTFMFSKENNTMELNFISPSFSFLPAVKLSYNNGKGTVLTMGYKKTRNVISYNDVYPYLVVNNYNDLSFSTINEYYSIEHKFSFNCVVQDLVSGITFIGNIGSSIEKGSITNDYTNYGIVCIATKSLMPTQKNINVLSTFEKKFFFAPINAKLSFQTGIVYRGMLINGEYYNNRTSYVNIIPSFETCYKQGFNFLCKINYNISGNTSEINESRILNTTSTIQVSFNKAKWFASFVFRDWYFKQMAISQNTIYHDVNVSYSLNDRIKLSVYAVDIFHLKQRESMIGEETDFVSSVYIKRFLPGHLILGVSYRF